MGGHKKVTLSITLETLLIKDNFKDEFTDGAEIVHDYYLFTLFN